MAVIGSLNAILTTDTRQWKSGMKEARDETDKTKKKFFDLKELSSSFGKKSALGQSLKLAAGGGAIGALSAAGRELRELTGKMLELKAQLKSGEIGMGEFLDKTASGLPVLGPFYEAGKNITEMFTGQAAAAAKADAAMSAVIATNNKALAQINSSKAATKAFAESQADQRKQLSQSTILAGIDDTTQKAIQEENFKFSNAMDKLQSELEKNAHNDSLAAIGSEITAANKMPEGASKKAKLNALAVEQSALAKEKAKALAEAGKTEIALEKEHTAALSKIKREAANKDAKEEAQIATKAAEEQKRDSIKDLEAQKKELEENIRKNKKSDTTKIAESEALRGGGIVQLSPGNAMQKISEDQLAELKYLNEKLAALKDGAVEDSQDVFVNF